MSVKDLNGDDSYVAKRKEFKIKHGGKDLTFIASEIGYLSAQNIGLRGSKGDNTLALLVAESISDTEGNRFTYEEVQRMKEEVATPFLDAALEVNKKKDSEKN